MGVGVASHRCCTAAAQSPSNVRVLPSRLFSLPLRSRPHTGIVPVVTLGDSAVAEQDASAAVESEATSDTTENVSEPSTPLTPSKSEAPVDKVRGRPCLSSSAKLPFAK